MFICIWCEDSNRGIGKDNKLPWSISDELLHFKKTTFNHSILMGKNTFLSIGKALPNRNNIVLSTTLNESEYENIKVINSFEDFVNKHKDSQEKIFIIGGKQIYDLFIPHSKNLIVSKLKKPYDCDVFMDNDFSNFKLTNIENKSLFDIYFYEEKN